jgi:hypothetical protein
MRDATHLAFILKLYSLYVFDSSLIIMKSRFSHSSLVFSILARVFFCLLTFPPIVSQVSMAQQRTMDQCLKHFGDGIGCQIKRTGPYPYDCLLNQRAISCSGLQSRSVGWADGSRTTFVAWRELGLIEVRWLQFRYGKNLSSVFTDSLGGKWFQELLPFGDSMLLNFRSNSSFYIPLRASCQSPLIGKVGYCLPQGVRN